MNKSLFSFLHPRAQVEFTNRETPIKIFKTCLTNIEQTQQVDRKIKILQFYGIGGIGKSRLLLELKKLLLSLYPESLVGTLDFDDGSIIEPHRALLRLRQTLKINTQLDFKLFDYAYAIYFAKRNPDYQFEERQVPYIEEIGIIGNILSGLDGLGIIGAAKEIIERIYKYLEQVTISNTAKEALLALQQMSEREIEDTLPDFLAYDLIQHTKNNRPIVLFIDTYEALWESYSSEKDAYQKDAWLRRLCQCLPSGLIVIAGREKLNWSEYDPVWKNTLETHLLNRLSDKDVENFLKSAGINDHDTIDRISQVSEGHPYYLDLCLDTFAQEGKIGFNDWPETRRDLFERFARSINSSELALLKRLAPLSSYDQDYIWAVIKKYNIALNADEVQAHFRFSFVKRHNDETTIHDIMRRSLLNHSTHELVRDIREFAYQHFTERLCNIRRDTPDVQIIRPLKEAARQLREIRDKDLTEAWLKENACEAIRVLQLRAAPGPIIEALETILDILPWQDWPSEIQTAYADVTHLIGQYENSVAILTEQLSQSSEEIWKTPQLAFAAIRRIHHSMMYRPISEVWKEAEDAIQALKYHNHNNALGEALFLIGGNLGATRGLAEEAIPWLAEALKIAKEDKNDQLRIRIYRKASDINRIKGNLKRSKILILKAMNLCESLQAIRYLNYIDCTFCDQLRLERQYESALQKIHVLRSKIAASNLEGWLGHTYLCEAAIHMDCGNTSLSIENLGNAWKYYQRTKHLWGLMQCAGFNIRLRILNGNEVSEKELLETAYEIEHAGYIRDAQELRLLKQHPALPIPAIAFL